MITRLALWTAGALAVGLLAGALAVTLAIRPQVLAQTVPTYSLPGLYSAAFDGAGIQANAIVAGDGSTAWQIPPSALAPTPAEDRWLKTASDDATATEWAELPENRLLPEYLQADEEFLSSRAGTLDWQAIHQVPIAGSVGHALLKTGDDDDEYRFGQVGANALPLATGGGLHFNQSGNLATQPSLVAVAAEADDAHTYITEELPAAAPANVSEAKQYELNVPATQGRPTWVEAAAASTGGPAPYNNPPVMVSDASSRGESDLYSRGDHVHQYALSIPPNHLTYNPNSALAGRFLSVTTIDNANPRAEWVGISQWPGHASVTPVEIAHNTGAFTMRATLDRVSGTFPAGAQMRLVAYTRTGDFVHAVANDFSTPATLTYTADQTTALLLQARNHTLVATLQVYDDNQATTLLAELPVYITVRQIADAPDNAATAKQYELQVPASGAATWVEATGGTVDQSARDAASEAQTTADGAGTAAENARSAADAAQSDANTANAGIADLQNRLVALRNIRYIGTSSAYNTLVTAQSSSDTPIMVLATARLTGTVRGAAYDYPVGTLIYLAPRTTSPQARPFVIPYRFEAAVGSSPSTLPVGTHTIVATAKLTTGTDTVKYSRTFLVSDLSTASELWSMDTGNPSSYSDNRDFTISLAYNPTSRALTYTWTTGLQRTTISEQSIKAIGVTQ